VKFQFAIIAAILGLMSSGPTGAVIGFLIGMYIDYVNGPKDEDDPSYKQRQRQQNRYDRYPPVDFKNSLLILIAAIMNADGSVLKSELELVKAMLVRTYGEYEAKVLLLRLRDYLKESHNLAEVCRNLRVRMSYSPRLELVHVLFRISRADGDISASELNLIQQIATQLGISTPDYLSIRAMFVSSPDSDYQILEITANATEEETKKAYRKMVMRFHPDRLHDLDDAERKAAEAKFIKVQQAYENVKKAKGWKG
jgi:DnaJ like chaperone protein